MRAGLPRNEVILRPARGLEWLGAGLPERTVAALETDAPAILVVPTWQRSKTTALTDAAFLALAPTVPVRTQVETFPLAEANAALDRLRAGSLTGAAVLIP